MKLVITAKLIHISNSEIVTTYGIKKHVVLLLTCIVHKTVTVTEQK